MAPPLVITEAVIADFNGKTEPGENGCALWTGCLFRDGYGRIDIGCWPRRAHRIAWTIAHGPIPAGLWVLHRCDTPRCVNPAHLFLGTHQDNIDDMVRKGRQAKGEKSGRRTKPWRTARGLRSGMHTRPERRPCGDRNGRRLHPERYPLGEAHPLAVLTDEIVRAIRREYAAGGIGQRALASRYGIGRNTVRNVIKGATWKHVASEQEAP